jgi:amidohydrolase
MDALPYNDDGSVYKHLCGHHANMVTLLTTISILNKIKDKLNVNVRFIFQPAEESVSGSEVMIEGGCLDGVDEILATHTRPEVALGEVSLVSGGCMAGADMFELRIKGSSTHAAMPAAADYIMSVQTVISRLIDPTESGVISFGAINGGNASNILPEEIVLKGTYRHFDKKVKAAIEKGMKERLSAIESFYGVKGELSVFEGTPPVISDKKIVADLKGVCKKSGITISSYDSKVMGGEDFAFYLEHVPGAFIWQGVNTGSVHPPLHNKNYTVPDDAVLPGIKLLTEYILSK